MSYMVLKAYHFAKDAHGDQKRKYTGEPYINHPLSVAMLVAEHVHDSDTLVCAAILHDVIEDTDVTKEMLVVGFGELITSLVLQLTDVSTPKDGNRAARKAKDREHLASATTYAKQIKLADLIDNSRSIAAHDPEFAKIYMAEKKLLLPVLKVNGPLFDMASKIVNDYYDKVGE